MVGIEHEQLVRLFSNRPELAAELLCEAFGLAIPDYSEPRIESADLTDAVPAEYRASPALAKHLSWPY